LEGSWLKASLVKKLSMTPSQQISQAVVSDTVIPATWESEIGGSMSEASHKQKTKTKTLTTKNPIRPYLKNSKAKSAGGMAQVVEHLPNPSTTKISRTNEQTKT
jgi:hypothetical protein